MKKIIMLFISILLYSNHVYSDTIFNHGETFATLKALSHEFNKWHQSHNGYPQNLCDLGNNNPIQPMYEYKNKESMPLLECYDMKYSYVYKLIETGKDSYLIVANPASGVNPEYAGKYSFCIMEDGIVRVDKEGNQVGNRNICNQLPEYQASEEEKIKAQKLITQTVDAREEIKKIIEEETGEKVTEENFEELAGFKPITDIKRYEKLMSGGKTEIDQHFPNKIPEDATNVSFYYLPPVMMADGHVQLRLKRPTEEIKKLHQEFSNKKIKSFMGNDSAGKELFLTSFLTSDPQGGKFPADYEIILLGESDWRKDRNHGNQYGVAISLEKSEIVYWLDMW